MLTLLLLLVALRLAAAAPMDHQPHGTSWEELYHQSWPQLPYSPDSSNEAAHFGQLPYSPDSSIEAADFKQEPSMPWSPHAFRPSSPQQWSFDAHVPAPGRLPADVGQDKDVMTVSDDSSQEAHAPSNEAIATSDESSREAHAPFNDAITISDSSSQEQQSASSTASTGRQAKSASISTADNHSQMASSSRVRRPASNTGWWEPSSVRAIDIVPPLRQGNYMQASIDVRHNDALRAQINNRLFAGKLHWVPNDQLALLSNVDLRNMWPLRRASRPLPFVDPPRVRKGEARIRLFMTQHTHSKGNSALASSELGKRPHYLFWGVQETPAGTGVVSYGAGYIEANDHEAVNKHLQPLLDALKRAD